MLKFSNKSIITLIVTLAFPILLNFNTLHSDTAPREYNIYNSTGEFYLGMTFDNAREQFRKCVIKAGIANIAKTKEADYLRISSGKSETWMYSYSSITGNTPTLIFSEPDKQLRIIKESIDAGLFSKKYSKMNLQSKKSAFLNEMTEKYGKYSLYVRGTWGGYIWKKENYRIAMHYLPPTEKFEVYHTTPGDLKAFPKPPFINKYFQNMSKKMK